MVNPVKKCGHVLVTYDVKTELVKFCFCFGGAGAARRDRKNDPTLTPECYTWVLFVGIRGHPGYIPGYHRWMWIMRMILRMWWMRTIWRYGGCYILDISPGFQVDVDYTGVEDGNWCFFCCGLVAEGSAHCKNDTALH